jgi:pseudaminic acid biosynthesis-associated methylase
MQPTTRQERFWSSAFGKGYNDRNTYTVKGFDSFYRRTWGVTRTAMNRRFLKGLRIERTLEVGANIGLQLRHLQAAGLDNLTGIEVQWDAVERAKRLTRHINILQGSAFDLPFKDDYFDLVFTSGVLIHINPKDHARAAREMERVSRKYIWGFEYFSERLTEIPYRGNRNVLWKTNFPRVLQRACPKLKLVKLEKFPYRDGSGNVDVMYLFRK